MYVLFVWTAFAEATCWQRHCYNNLSRAWCVAVHAQVNSLSVPACVHHCPRSPYDVRFHWIQASALIYLYYFVCETVVKYSDEHICLFVCSQNRTPQLHQFSMHIAYGLARSSSSSFVTCFFVFFFTFSFVDTSCFHIMALWLVV